MARLIDWRVESVSVSLLKRCVDWLSMLQDLRIVLDWLGLVMLGNFVVHNWRLVMLWNLVLDDLLVMHRGFVMDNFSLVVNWGCLVLYDLLVVHRGGLVFHDFSLVVNWGGLVGHGLGHEFLKERLRNFDILHARVGSRNFVSSLLRKDWSTWGLNVADFWLIHLAKSWLVVVGSSWLRDLNKAGSWLSIDWLLDDIAHLGWLSIHWLRNVLRSTVVRLSNVCWAVWHVSASHDVGVVGIVLLLSGGVSCNHCSNNER